MSRPHSEVSVVAALPQRGSPTATGTAMMAFYGGTGVTTPVIVTSTDQVTSAYGTTGPVTTLASYVGDALANGAPKVVLVKVVTAAGTSAATVLTAEWTSALSLLTSDFGACAQVAIPGVSTQAAHDALVAHAGTNRSRTVFLDFDSASATPATGVTPGTAATLVAAATGYASSAGAERTTIVAPPVTMAASASATRVSPASVLAMGLAARNDARVGHTNNAPAGDQQNRGVGVIVGAIAPVDVFSATDRDAMNDAGVSVIKAELGVPMLYGWASVSSDTRFHELSTGRFQGQLANDIDLIHRQFLFDFLDNGTFSALEAAIRDYLMRMRSLRAIWTGIDGSHVGFDVQVAPVNTPTTIAARTLVSAATVSITPYVEETVTTITTSNATVIG